LAAVLSALFDFLIGTAAVGLFLVVARVGISLYLLWFPLLVATLILLALALAIMFSAATLFFRDVRFLVEVLLTFAIFFTPVFYESALFGPWAPVLLINPVSPLLEGFSNSIVIHSSPSVFWVSYSVAAAAVLFCLAVGMFRKLEPFFAESV
jgi:ABC-type polysaccharide/polyol phosphate export permease